MEKKELRRQVLGYVAEYRGLFAIGILAMVLMTAANLAGPLILRSIIDESIPRSDLKGMIVRSLSFLGVVALSGAIAYVGSIVVARLGLNVVTKIKKDVFGHLLTLPVAYFDAHPVGELMARVESDSEKVKQLFSEIGIVLITEFFFFVGVLAVCFSLDRSITLWIAASLPPILAFVIVFFDRLRSLYDNSRKMWARISASVAEYVQGVEILRAFDRVAWAEASLDATARAKRGNDVRASMLEYSAMSGLGFLVGPAFMAAIVVAVAPQILSGAATLGTLLVFLEYGRRLLDPIMAIAENVRGFQQARVSLARILGILSLECEPGAIAETAEGAAFAPCSFERSIDFEGLWFRYSEDSWALRDVSFSMPKGSTIALVGPSGSGKSSVVNLLCRFYEPQRGRILVDGRPLSELGLAAWRRKIGLVLQDVYLFPGSLVENVRVYDDAIGEDRVRAALDSVSSGGFAQCFPKGLHSEIRERGANLSGGERQLVAFARAIAFGPEIVVLDEATASVDAQTERKIRESMAELLQGRTALLVAHRLSSVAGADEILFVKEGRIAARGRHERLMESFPEYAELVQLQFPEALDTQVAHNAEERDGRA
jgi:ATP-binding cassette, subfamily B, multidrug efflux pump